MKEGNCSLRSHSLASLGVMYDAAISPRRQIVFGLFVFIYKTAPERRLIGNLCGSAPQIGLCGRGNRPHKPICGSSYSEVPERFLLRGKSWRNRKEGIVEVSLPKIKPLRPTAARFIKRTRLWLTPLSLILALVFWDLVVRMADLPPFILPSPLRVGQRFLQASGDGTLLRHTAATLTAVTLGLMAGALLATVFGYLIAKSTLFEKLVAPYLVASQAIPIVAIAPLLVIWFGPGMGSKVLICGLIVFFPVLVNTVVGLRAVPDDLRALMQSLHATPLQNLRHLEIPAALPVFLGGLRVGATLSVIGGVVGELVGSDRGLGFLINVGRGQYDTALVFVAIFTLVTLALALYGLVVLMEQRLLSWQKASSRQIDYTPSV
jgi:NitT/TauT family transport system permease protein